MAELLIDTGATTSRIIRIDKGDIPAKIQIQEGTGSDTATIEVSGDGVVFSPYNPDGTVQNLDESNTNARAIDTVGLYQITGKTGTSKVFMSTPKNI